MLARWLRRISTRASDASPVSHARRAMLSNRVAVMRANLLDIADPLERADAPDPGCVAALCKLLSDRCESPLYNHDVDPSELRRKPCRQSPPRAAADLSRSHTNVWIPA